MGARVRFQDLCMDTVEGEQLGRFWAETSDLRFDLDGGTGRLVGPTDGHRIWMNQVPEPRTVKHRVHLDVYAASVDDLVARGASVVLAAEESGFSWTVMADPEGGEFCAFLRDPSALPDYRIHGIVVDSHDPQSIAQWWGDLFGAPVHTDDAKGWWWLEDVPGMPIKTMDFVPVPEPKAVKNRIHWDVRGSAESLREAGATLLRARDDEITWTVMADPEGNEFCVFDD